MRFQRRQWTEEQKKDIIDMYTTQGKTLKEIAVQYKAKADTISKYLNSWGINTVENKSRSKNRTTHHDYFHEIDTPNKAYFLGLLFADGSVCPDSSGKRNPQVSIELAEYDKEIIEKLKTELNSGASLYQAKRKNRQFSTVSFSLRSAQLAKDLSVWGIIPNKTYLTKQLVIPDAYKIDYLRGLIDGDGSVFTLSKNELFQINICGHSEDIIYQIAELGNSLIGKNGVHKITCYNNVYRYTWQGKEAIKLGHLLYNTQNYYIDRKHDKALISIKDWCIKHNINENEIPNLIISNTREKSANLLDD